MTSCLKRRDLSWIIVFLLTFATSLATRSNQLLRAHVNKLNLSSTICFGKEPISIPIEEIQKELDELSEIERDIDNVRTAKLSDDPDKPIKYYYIDVVAIADYSLYKNFSGDRLKIRTQIAHLFFGAKRVYLQNKFSIPEMFDFKIVLNLVDIIIVESREESILNKIREGDKKNQVDANKGLKRLMDFKYEGSYDHITLFTALDLALRDDESGELDNSAVGMAYKHEMCYPYLSFSIVEHQWRGIDMLTLVHEIGHSLGAVHDGEQNDCSAEDEFLMTPVENEYSNKEKALNKWRFSECSRKEIASNILRQYNGAYVKYLEGVYVDAGLKYTESEKAADSQYMADCFTKKIPIKKYVPDVSKRFQGSDYNFAEQCTLRGYEPPGLACQGRNPEQQSCFVRYCNITKIYYLHEVIKSHECIETIPYRGTRCGTDKVCEAGFCRSIEELKNLKMSFSSNLTAPFCFTPSPFSSSRCLHDYGLNMVIVTLLVGGTLTL